MSSPWFESGLRVGNGLRVGCHAEWVSQPASRRFAQNVQFVKVVLAGFADADPDDVQLEELTWPQWEGS